MSSALRRIWQNKLLWAIHVIVNAALLAAIYGWLSIPDRTVLDLVLSALAGLGIVLVTSWLHGGTMEFFRSSHQTGGPVLWQSFRPSTRRIAVFAGWLLVLVLAIVLVLQLRGRVEPVSNWIASALTLQLQRPVSPASVSRILSAVVWLAAFFATPFLLLRFWKWKWTRKHLLIYSVLFVVAAYIPYRLIWWVPELEGLYAQSVSMGARFVLAYLLAVTGWLALASTLGDARR